MNVKRFTLLIACFVVLGIVATSRSGGPAAILGSGYTGAPTESTCSTAGCHSGGSYGTVTPSIQMFTVGGSTPLTSYSPGTQYDMKVTVNHSAGTPVRYGFQLTALKVTGNVALAGYSNLQSGVSQVPASGRTYVEHNTPSVSNQFTFRWTAPASGTGSVRFYASGNCVNNNGSSAGDNAGNASFLITELVPLAVTGTKTNVTCFGLNNGTINITASGGTPTYTYVWSDGPTTEDRTGLAPGTYSVVVTDAASGTVTSSNFVITQPAAPLGITLNVGAILCTGGSSTVTVGGTGGTPTYTGQGTFTLAPGVHTRTITDANGCTKDTTFTIGPAPSPITVNAVVNGQIPCNGNGTTVTVTASGGTGALTGTGTFTVTTPGSHTYTVTDVNNCSGSSTVTVNSVSGLTVTTNIIQPGCADTCAGILVSNIQTTSLPYLESLETFPGGLAVTNDSTLCPGVYLYEVEDAAGCTFSGQVTVESPEHPTVEVTQITNANGGNNGSVNITVSGGESPYTFDWSNGNTSEDLNNVGDDVYTVTVTGDNDCETEVVDIEVFDVASMDEAAALGLSVYPNPFSGSFQLSDENWKVISVRDISGRKIAYQQTGQNVVIQHPTAGVYLIQMKRDDKMFVFRMISE